MALGIGNLLAAFGNMAAKSDKFVDPVARRIQQRLNLRKTQSDDIEEEPPDILGGRKPDGLDDLWEELHLDQSRFDTGVNGWRQYMADDRTRESVDVQADYATVADGEGRILRIALDVDTATPNARQTEAFERLEKMIQAWRLEEQAPQIAKRALVEGDSYYELVTDKARRDIIKFKVIKGARENHLMKKVVDDNGALVAWHLYYMRSGRLVRAFAPWQVVPFPWNSFDDDYGTSILASGKLDFERLLQMEASLFVAREERAYLKVIHIFKGYSSHMIRRMRQWLRADKRRNGTGPASDIVTNQDAKIVDPQNTGLSNIEDVKHVEAKRFAGGKTPKGFLSGYGDDINRAVLEKQEEGFLRHLSKIRRMLTTGFNQAKNTQLLLWEIIPEEVPVSWQWSQLREKDVDATTKALGTQVEKLGLSPQSALQELGRDPEQEAERRQQYAKDERALEVELDSMSDAAGARTAKELQTLLNMAKEGNEDQPVDVATNGRIHVE